MASTPTTGPLFPRAEAPDDRSALALGAEGPVWSYRAVRLAADAHRRAAEASGLRPGDLVAIRMGPDPGILAALVGHALSGLVTVPIDPRLGERSLDHVIADAKPQAFVAPETFSAPAKLPLLAPPTLSEAAPGVPSEAGRGPDDAPLLVLYTSGTTGPPKGAVLTAANVAADLDGLAQAWAWTDRDAVVHALPLFHVHGLVLGWLGALRRGGMMRWVPRFSPGALAAAIDRTAGDGTHQPVVFGVPTIHGRMADAAENDPAIAGALRRPRLLISGSAGLPLREHRRLEALTGRPVLERYGLTETLINTACRVDETPRPGTVGGPLPGVALRLLDDAGHPLPEDRERDGQTLGEIAVRGPNVFPGYLNRNEATRAVLTADGWFRTGDLARRDPDGRVRIAGRRSVDLIKTGGFKVGAGEVEGALLEHPAVAEAAVIGVPDPDLGERIVAHVVLRDVVPEPSDEALADHVAGLLSPAKRPRGIVRREALPRNAMGKVQKKKLQEIAGGGAGSSG